MFYVNLYQVKPGVSTSMNTVDKANDESRLKPNSHQTIFPTDFLRQPTIEKSVVIGRFFKNKSVGVTWKSMGTYTNGLIFLNRPIFSPIFTN